MTTQDDMVIDLSQSSLAPQVNPYAPLHLERPQHWDSRIKAALAKLPPPDHTLLRRKFIDGLALEYVSNLFYWHSLTMY
jgi:hypothetical protein